MGSPIVVTENVSKIAVPEVVEVVRVIERGEQGAQGVSHTEKRYTQVAHGFTALLTPVHLVAGVWATARADDLLKLGLGLIVDIDDVDNIKIAISGFYNIVGHGLTVDKFYYVANTGGLTDTEPNTSQPILYVIDNDNILILPYRPKEIIVDSIQFDTSAGVAVGQAEMAWNANEETLDVGLNGAILQLGQEIHYHVRNDTASIITDGTVVMATGTLGASGRITIGPMIGSDPANAKFLLGIATENIGIGEDGKVSHFGKVRGIDTSSWSEGDVLWVSPTVDGGLVNVMPTAPLTALAIAFVINSSANGTLFVRAGILDLNAFEPLKGPDDFYVTAADGTKLDGIETGATADQSDAEIKTAYENNTNTNAFTDADETKLDGIETGATADQTNLEIKTAYENNTNTNAFTDADESKLDGIEDNATADQTNAEIKTAYEANSNTNEFSDAEQTKLSGIPSTVIGDTQKLIKVNAAGTGYEFITQGAGGGLDADTVDGAELSDLVQTTGSQVIAGVKTFSDDLEVTGNTPRLSFIENGVAADSGHWAIRIDGTILRMRLLNDAETVATNFLNVFRTGTTLNSVVIHGRTIGTDGAKLDTIETSATADQSDAEIKTAYENNTNTNAFTDADESKLDGIEDNATADQTDAQIKTAYENNTNTNEFSDAEQAKLGGIPSTVIGDAQKLIKVNAAGNAYEFITQGAGGGLDADTVDGAELSDLVQTTGTQTIGGTKTFTSSPIISNNTPRLLFHETDASADNGFFEMIVTSESFRLRLTDDTQTASTNFMIVQRTANTVDSVIIHDRDIKVDGTKLDTLVLADLVQTSGAQTIAGAKTFTTSPIISSTVPTLELIETDASADNKLWRIKATGEAFRIQAINDVGAGSDFMVVNRTGIVIDSVIIDGRDIGVDGAKLDTLVLADLVQTTGAQSIDGNKTFTSNTRIQLASPRLTLEETDAAIDNGHFQLRVDNEIFRMRLLNDAETVATDFLVVNRTGTTLDSVVIDGRDIGVDGTKLDGIETGATADQTDGEIKTAYENNSNTNVFTDAEQTKLGGIETGATADQTNAEIKAAYEANSNTNAFTDADESKLDGIATGAEVNPDLISQAEAEAGVATTERIFNALRVKQAVDALGTPPLSDAEIKTAYEANSNTNEFSDAEQTKLSGIETGAEVNPSNAETKTAYEANTDTNVFTDTEQTKLGNIFSGRVSATGSPVGFPSGWSVVKSGTGDYDITHNLGTTVYLMVATPSLVASMSIAYASRSSNTITIRTYNISGGATDAEFSFILIKI